MGYELAKMIGNGRNRKVRPKAVPLKRPFTESHEKALLAIYLSIIAFWRQAFKNDFLTDALPDPERTAGVNTAALITLTRNRLLQWLATLTAFERKQWVREVERRTGVNIDNMASDMADDFDVLASLLWAQQLAEDLSNQIRSRLTTSLVESRSLRRTQKEALEAVSEVFEKARRRAELIAHDQSQKIAAKVVEKQQLEAGVTRYVWNHSFQKNPRRHHVERQGNIYEWAKPPRDGHPGHAPNCRCTAAAYLEAA